MTPPRIDEIRRDMADAERSEGWLMRCDVRDVYLAITRELVSALADVLTDGGEVVELAAGDGRLAEALRGRGVAVEATDARPAPGAEAVAREPAEATLARLHPSTVLGSFVPFDAGIDQAVLACSSVRRYVVLNARLGGALGSPCLWHTPGWLPTPLRGVTQAMITRHDVWLGEDTPPIRHGEAWLLTRIEASQACHFTAHATAEATA